MSVGDEQFKELAAHFGLAYYLSEVVHRGLCNLYALLQIGDGSGMTSTRVEEHQSFAYKQTLGAIGNLVASALPADIASKLQEVLSIRNFLAHQFWFERAYLMNSAEGVRSMLAELNRAAELFSDFDAQVDALIPAYHARCGVMDSAVDAHLQKLTQGDPGPPPHRQRRLSKQETVVAAYETPAVLFQTEDGHFWQLCDVGLGWTKHQQTSSDWKYLDAIQRVLPAQVDPRPTMTTPWSYEIRFGGSVTLVVRPGPDGTSFRYSIRTR